jgi:hypothetical protein
MSMCEVWMCLRAREWINRSKLGVEAPRWQAARRAHTPPYVTDAQRRQRGWIGVEND